MLGFDNLIDKLVVIADGNIDLVQKAIRACAKGPEGGAELKDVVDYIVKHRREDMDAVSM